MKRFLISILSSMTLLLTACAPPLTLPAARATALAGGCWPFGADQPPTPTQAARVRPGTPTPSPQPTVRAYPACTPLPGTPTATLRPTATARPRVLPTPPPARLAGGVVELGQQPGTATVRSRQVHTPALAIRPQDGRAAVAWYVWGAQVEASYAGDLWVRVQDRQGRWAAAQTLNAAPIGGFLGGLGITWTVSETLAVLYGAGGQGGDWGVRLSERRDGDTAWTTTLVAPQGQAEALTSDAAGTLHALLLVGPGGVVGQARYGTRVVGGAWVWHDLPHTVGYNGQLALLPQAGGGLRRFVLLNAAEETPPTGAPLTLYWSDDGVVWQTRAVALGRYLAQEHPTATSLVAAQRPDGTGVVAMAWSQPNGPGAVAGGVFATVSLDGGQHWGDEERIAQHRADGSFGDAGGGQIGGFEPSLAYDRATDHLAVSWVEDDLSRTAARTTSTTNRVVRTLLATRALTPDAPWRFAVTPTGAADAPPQLTAWGVRGHLWGSADGRWAWLTQVNERNRQARVGAQPLLLRATVDGAL